MEESQIADVTVVSVDSAEDSSICFNNDEPAQIACEPAASDHTFVLVHRLNHQPAHFNSDDLHNLYTGPAAEPPSQSSTAAGPLSCNTDFAQAVAVFI